MSKLDDELLKYCTIVGFPFMGFMSVSDWMEFGIKNLIETKQELTQTVTYMKGKIEKAEKILGISLEKIIKDDEEEKRLLQLAKDVEKGNILLNAEKCEF
jgi:hypothetical protein